MEPGTLDVLEDAFPGRPAFDAGVSRALLRDVAEGLRGETLRLYRPADVVAFSTTDLRRPGFARAVAAARDQGFDAALRLAGGSAAVFHRDTVAFAWCRPERDMHGGIHPRFEQVSAWVVRALETLGVDARVGEVPGAYCPGDYSVNAGGRSKLMGVGQRVVRGAAHTGGVIVVGSSQRVRDVLVPVYEALGFEYDPTTTGAVDDEVPGVGCHAVRDALLAALDREHSVGARPLGPETLERAAVYEESFTLP